MSSAAQPPEEHLGQLRRFLAWLLPTAVGVAGLLLLIVSFYPSYDLTIACIAVSCYSLLLIWARAQLARGGAWLTVGAICLGMFALALGVTSTAPSSAPALILLPFMAVTVALPYVRARALRQLSLIAWLIAVVEIVLFQLDRYETLAGLLPNGIQLILGVAGESALILLLLWQFRSRLHLLLGQAREANAALKEANTLLEAQHAQIVDEREALRRSEEQFRLIFEIAPIGMALADVDGRFLRVNQALCATLGYPAEELLHHGFADITHPDDLAAHEALGRQLLSGEIAFFQTERRYVGRDGRAIDTIVHAALVRDSLGRPLHIAAQVVDVTERKQAEERRLALERKLLEAQKLESLGVLAGGIAHDFNNLLVGILGNTSLVVADLPPGSFAHERVGQIETAALRAAELTRQMLAYAGKGRFVVEPLDLNTLIDEIARLLSTSVTKNASLRYQLAPDLPAIEGDATQIRQVLMNLIVNASEAIGNQPGNIQIRTGTRRIGPAGSADELRAGEYVLLEVADTGCGMDEATLARIFDPFFTTKFTGRGLGLAAVQGIVRSHRGALTVESAPGQGTTFSILLPCISAPPALVRAPEPPAVLALGDGETVLLIDDEPDVRIVAEQMLRYAGFNVLLASSGQAGIELFQEHANTIACVLLDLTMPAMDGEEVFHRLRALRPELPIVLMSGYSEQEVGERFAGAGLAGFLQKPFTLKALQAKVQRALATEAKRET